MSRKEISSSKEQSAVKVNEILTLLKATQRFLKTTDKNSRASSMLGELIQILGPYRNSTLLEVESMLKIAHPVKASEQDERREQFLENFRLEHLQDPNLRNTLSRKELTVVAQRELGISKSRLMKLGRNEIDIQIENALESLRTLRTIGKTASENSVQ